MKYKLVNKTIKQNYVEELLLERGLRADQLDYFLNVPDASALQDPASLLNIHKGYEDLTHMMQLTADDRVILVVDSDVDGYTSAAIFYLYLRYLNEQVQIEWVHHRGKGHGLSDTIGDILEKQNNNPNIAYVVLPDSSSNDYEYHEQLGAEGIRSLILDHHIVEPDTQFSSWATVINNQLSPDYLNKDLSGAGVTWQFCRYCDELLDDNYADTLIDLAALGIVSDMMSMLSLENRYIVHNGFAKVKNYFFQTLCIKQDFSMGGKVTPMTVAFYITPLINAMTRAGEQDEKDRCFQAFVDGHAMVVSHKRGAKGTMEEVAIESARECTNARTRQNRLLDQAVEQLEIKIAKYGLLENKILFVRLDDEDFPSEFNGLTAMKLAARHRRPTIVARLNNEGYDRGSSRGLNESELKSFKHFMDESGFFEYTAGHDNACGVSILDKNLSDFHTYANKALADVDFGENSYEINFERYAADTDIENLITDITNYNDIWGQGNSEPLIYISDLNITPANVTVMGKNKDTVKIEKNGVAYMFFKCADRIEEFKKFREMKINLIGTANMDKWMGRTTPQIFVTDFEILDNTLGF